MIIVRMRFTLIVGEGLAPPETYPFNVTYREANRFRRRDDHRSSVIFRQINLRAKQMKSIVGYGAWTRVSDVPGMTDVSYVENGR